MSVSLLHIMRYKYFNLELINTKQLFPTRYIYTRYISNLIVDQSCVCKVVIRTYYIYFACQNRVRGRDVGFIYVVTNWVV